MNYFEIFNEVDAEIIEIKEVAKLIEYTLKFENLTNVLFNIIIINDDNIKNINKEYRNIDSVTDVISFALEDEENSVPDIRVLGDIYISYDTAKRQAGEYNHSLLRELSFLSVHGLLHLLGYDHMNVDDELVMFEKQKEILDNYGIVR